MSRQGQFFEGERSLCFGVSLPALKRETQWDVKVGKRRYRADVVDLLDFITKNQKACMWESKGKPVCILPLNIFYTVYTKEIS